MPRVLRVRRDPPARRRLLCGLLREPVLLRLSSSPLPLLFLQPPKAALSIPQPGDMQTVDELNELPEWVDAVLVLMVRLLLVFISVLQVLLWTFLACLVADILTYLRGY